MTTLADRVRRVLKKLRIALRDGKRCLRDTNLWRPLGRFTVICLACGSVHAWHSALPPDSTELPHREWCPIDELRSSMEKMTHDRD